MDGSESAAVHVEQRAGREAVQQTAQVPAQEAAQDETHEVAREVAQEGPAVADAGSVVPPLVEPTPLLE